MSANQHAPYYFVPEPSKWPLFGSIAAVFLTFGASGTVNQQAAPLVAAGWFFDVVLHLVRMVRQRSC